MEDLFTKVNISDILQFLQECDFYNKIYRFSHFYIFHIFMSVGWNVKWCPVSRITTPLARGRPFRWISMNSWGPPGKLQNWSHETKLQIVTAVPWLKYCRYGVQLYPINQLTLKTIYRLFTIFQCISDGTFNGAQCQVRKREDTWIKKTISYAELLFVTVAIHLCRPVRSSPFRVII